MFVPTILHTRLVFQNVSLAKSYPCSQLRFYSKHPQIPKNEERHYMQAIGVEHYHRTGDKYQLCLSSHGKQIGAEMRWDIEVKWSGEKSDMSEKRWL